MTLTLLNNRYRIIRDLGAGGFGNTFLAEDTHLPSRRTCVIKQLKPVTDNPRAYEIAQQRFEREAAVLEELGEGNSQIPKLYAYFSEAGQFYLVQEWIEGKTLTDKVQQQGVLSSAAVRDILVRLLPVLEYVHSKRIIHRDIKPDNIILRDSDNLPVLIDFGAVKEAMGTTTHSIIIGTPGFMSSEQTVGQPVYSSDLYSLALTAIYLLTGKIPQELSTDSRTKEFGWHEYARNVSPSLTAVLDKSIRHRASDRFSTASEMLDALQQSAANAPNLATPSTQSTLVVSPSAPDTAGSEEAAVGGPQINQQQRQKRWAIAMLSVSAVIGTALALTQISHKSPQPSQPVSSSSPSATEPTPKASQTPAPSSSPSPTATEPTPKASQTPAPSSSPSPETPDHKPGFFEKPGLSQSVPAFPTGTPRTTVKAALGKPVKDARGAWGNTRAVIYQYKPNEIDLGYLFDRNSGRIRQTEASFAESVDPQVMLTTLDGLLNGEATPAIKRGLRRVQQGKSNAYIFTIGSLKGQIVRQDCGFIYISIWDAELHNFNVASSRKC